MLLVSAFAAVCTADTTAAAMPEAQHHCSLKDGQRVCQATTSSAPLLVAAPVTSHALVVPDVVVFVLMTASSDFVSDPSVRPLSSRSPPAA